MEHVLTLTFNPTVDAASEAETIHPTHKIRTSKESFHPGGGGINVARMIVRLGGPATALYVRGGPMGTVLDHLLESRGIKRQTVEISGKTRVNLVIHERSTGREYRFIAEGPILRENEWQACVNVCETLEWNWLVASGSLPRGVPVEIYDHLIALANRRGAAIVIDTSGDGLKHVMTRKGLTLIKPSQREFETCTQRRYKSVAEIADMAQTLVRKGTSKIIAVTLGHRGAILATAGETMYLPAPEVRVISASGAGDSFIGGMVHALVRGDDVADAFKLGVACGSAAVMEKGTRLCRISNVEKLLRNLSPVPPDMALLPSGLE